MENLLKEMGKRLVERRKQLRLTQEEVAERADLTTQTISTAETGKKALRPANIISICAALDISPDYLLLGRISGEDRSILSQKVSQLSPEGSPSESRIRIATSCHLINGISALMPS